MDATRASRRIANDALLELGHVLSPHAFDIRPADPCFEIVVYDRDGSIATRMHVTLERLNSRFQRGTVIERLMAGMAGARDSEHAPRSLQDLVEA